MIADFAHFNSIKVRLELDKLLRLQQQAGKFQFHKGAIRTHGFAHDFIYVAQFQFHKGAIRTPLLPCVLPPLPISIP